MPMHDKRLAERLLRAMTLILAPVVILAILRLLSLVSGDTARSTLAGCWIAAAGGLLCGAVAERLLHRGKGGTQQLVGFAATTVIGAITVGILYLGYLNGPMITVGTPQRAVEQILAFGEFLSAQGAGIYLALPRPQAHPATP